MRSSVKDADDDILDAAIDEHKGIEDRKSIAEKQVHEKRAAGL